MRAIAEIREELGNVQKDIRFVRDPWIKQDLGKRRRALQSELVEAQRTLRLEQLTVEIKAQWAKFDKAQSEGMTGAPLAQIDAKLGRLEREHEALEIEMSRAAEATR